MVIDEVPSVPVIQTDYDAGLKVTRMRASLLLSAQTHVSDAERAAVQDDDLAMATAAGVLLRNIWRTHSRAHVLTALRDEFETMRSILLMRIEPDLVAEIERFRDSLARLQHEALTLPDAWHGPPQLRERGAQQ